MLPDDTIVDSFTQWAHSAEAPLRHALTASFGPQIGKDAATDALSHAWEHWERVQTRANPLGYVYGIGRNKARRMARRRKPLFADVPVERLPHVEPGLPKALARLPEKQRIVVTLLHGYGWSMSEVADLLEIAKTTVQNHAERGLQRLRRELGVEL